MPAYLRRDLGGILIAESRRLIKVENVMRDS
jgi:hypothetical protein